VNVSSETQESTRDVEQEPADSDRSQPGAEASESQPLTITLPDGSASVSDAIVTHREMLIEPQEHGLATDGEITHLSEAMEKLSDDIEAATEQSAETRSQISELQDIVDRQQQQIDELQSTVTSLAEILGTEAEWQTFGDA
jgi:chromosome segregation ATPase